MEIETDKLEKHLKNTINNSCKNNGPHLTSRCNESDQIQIEDVQFNCEKCDQMFEDFDIRDKHIAVTQTSVTSAKEPMQT